MSRTVHVTDPQGQPTGPAEATQHRTPLRPLPAGTIIPVAGISWRQDKAAKVAEGDHVTLRHDVTNSHDPWACSIHSSSGDLLGYVPAQGGVARRLTGLQPGGTWDGTIVEKLQGDTVGLRIRIGALRQEHVSLTVGKDVEGKWETEHVHDPATTLAAQQPVENTENKTNAELRNSALQVGHQAQLPNGRTLGTIVEVNDTHVRVKVGDNTIARYPRSLFN